MNVTMEMIADRLSVLEGVRVYGFFRPTALSVPRVFDRDIVALERSLLVSKAELLPEEPEIPPTSLLICAGITDKPQYHRNNFPFIEVPEVAFSALFLEVQNIYDSFLRWEEQAKRILREDADVERLLWAALPLLENSVSVTDTSMNSITRAFFPGRVEMNRGVTELNTQGINPVPVSNALDVRERIARSGYDVEPRLCEDYGGTVYNIDLFFGAVHIGQLSLMASERPFCPSDPQLLKLLARQVEKAFQIKSKMLEDQQGSLKMMLEAMLQGRHVNARRLREALPVPALPQVPRERFLAAFLAEDSGVFSTGYLQNLFERRIPGSFTMLHHGGVVCLIDGCVYPGSREELMQHLDELAQELSMSVGLSRWFSEIGQLMTAVSQAEIAAGEGRGDSPRVRWFEEAALGYMLHQLSGGFTAADLAPDGFGALLEYCATASVDYLAVLQTYLDQRGNATEAAKLLYLNRSTFLKRMQKIRFFLADALDDPDKLLRLSICMKIYRMETSRGEEQ